MSGTGDVLAAVISVLARNGIVANQLRVEQPSLEDAFVALTNHDSKEDSKMSFITQAIDARGTLRRRPAKARRRLLRTEAKLLLREPILIFWAVAFPLILTIAMGVAGDRHDTGPRGPQSDRRLRARLMAFVITILAVTALPAMLASYREKGVLRRMSTTPMRPAALLGADAAVNVSMMVVAIAVIAIAARLAFGVRLPAQGFGFVLALVLTAGAMLSLGALVASVAADDADRAGTRDAPVLPDDVLRRPVGAAAADVERAART